MTAPIRMEGLRSLRRSQRLSQEDVAKSLGVSRESYSCWENGRALPRAKYLPALAELLQCRIEDLYLPQEVKPEEKE